MRVSRTSHAQIVLLTIAVASGCQLAKPRLFAERQAAGNTDGSLERSTINEQELVLSASKSIDEALASSLSNKVEPGEYNLTSANATSYPARTKVTASKEQGCSSGCSH